MSTNSSSTPAVTQQATTSTNESPASSQNTTNSPTTTAPVATSPATTTPQSSPAQTTSSAGGTPASSASPASLTSTTAPSTTSTSSFTSQVATTFYSTDPSGSIVYITSSIPIVVTTAISSSTSGTGNSNSHTAVIVGSVVGGVTGIVILALLLLCIRRRVRKDEFDGNFDPDRVVGHSDDGGGTLPRVDLADEVSPFPRAFTDQDSSSMRQYSESPYIPVPSSPATSGQTSSEYYAPGAGAPFDAQRRSLKQPSGGLLPSGASIPPINMYGSGPVDWQSRISPPPSTVSQNTTSTRGAKEREALGRSGQGLGLGLATQPEAAEGSGDVVVHQDAGRAPAEEHRPPPREIPPAYDSIPQD